MKFSLYQIVSIGLLLSLIISLIECEEKHKRSLSDDDNELLELLYDGK
jgi:hypothetical protein